MEENDSQVGVSLGTKVGPVYWAQTSERKKSTVFLWKGKHNTAIQFSSVQFSRSVVSDSSQPHGLQHTRPPCLSPAPGVYPNSCPLSWWCHPAISSSVPPFSSWSQSFPASGSFPMSQLFTSGGQSIVASASASVLPRNIQGRFPLGLIGLMFLLSKRFLRVFSSITVWKH